MSVFVYRDGCKLTPYMNYQLSRLDADLRRVFGVSLHVNDGLRTNQDQIDIFLSRYVTADNINGRYVYDVRWWRGLAWYRISDEGTVATPGSSNHEIQGNTAAVDIRDTGSDAGIANRWSDRGQWLRNNCGNYDMYNSGDGFGEGWHFDMYNIFTPVATEPSPPAQILVHEKDIDMLTLRWNHTHIFSAAMRKLNHESDIGQANQAGWLFNRNDRMGNNIDGSKSLFVEVDNVGLNRIQRSLALPWYAFDLTMSGRAFDLEGNLGKGHFWSKEDELMAELRKTGVRTEGLAKTLDQLVAKYSTKTAGA